MILPQINTALGQAFDIGGALISHIKILKPVVKGGLL